MDYADLLDGLVPDLERELNDLDPNADLPADLVLVEDGDPQPEAIARLNYLRDYAVMCYGAATLELVEEPTETETLVVRVLDPTDVTITVEDETVVREGGEERENVFVETHSREQDYYGTPFVDRDVETVEDAHEHAETLLSDLNLLKDPTQATEDHG